MRSLRRWKATSHLDLLASAPSSPRPASPSPKSIPALMDLRCRVPPLMSLVVFPSFCFALAPAKKSRPATKSISPANKTTSISLASKTRGPREDYVDCRVPERSQTRRSTPCFPASYFPAPCCPDPIAQRRVVQRRVAHPLGARAHLLYRNYALRKRSAHPRVAHLLVAQPRNATRNFLSH